LLKEKLARKDEVIAEIRPPPIATGGPEKGLRE